MIHKVPWWLACLIAAVKRSCEDQSYRKEVAPGCLSPLSVGLLLFSWPLSGPTTDLVFSSFRIIEGHGTFTYETSQIGIIILNQLLFFLSLSLSRFLDILLQTDLIFQIYLIVEVFLILLIILIITVYRTSLLSLWALRTRRFLFFIYQLLIGLVTSLCPTQSLLPEYVCLMKNISCRILCNLFACFHYDFLSD